MRFTTFVNFSAFSSLTIKIPGQYDLNVGGPSHKAMWEMIGVLEMMGVHR